MPPRSIIGEECLRVGVVIFCLLLSLLACSCEKPGFLAIRGGLSSLVFEKIEAFGGPAILPTGNPLPIENYEYYEDNEGFQILCQSNHVATFLTIFQPHFGNPAILKTNSAGVSSFVYSVRQAGVAINCSVDTVKKTQKQYTHLVIVKRGVL